MKNRIFYATCVILTLLFLALDIESPLNITNGLLYVCIIFLSLWTDDDMFTIRASIVCSILTILGFFISSLGDRSLLTVIVDRSLSVTLLWMVAFLVIKRKKMERQKDAVTAELRESLAAFSTLKRLFPQCVTCKKVRLDNGIIDESQHLFEMCPHCPTMILRKESKKENQCPLQK